MNAPASTAPNLKGHRILLVDDAPDTLELFSIWLKRFGAIPVTETKPAAIVNRFDLPEINACVVDYEYEGMTGYELALTLRKLSFQGPIILLTGHDVASLPNHVVDSRVFDQILRKPISGSDLGREIERTLKGETHL